MKRDSSISPVIFLVKSEGVVEFESLSNKLIISFLLFSLNFSYDLFFACLHPPSKNHGESLGIFLKWNSQLTVVELGVMMLIEFEVKPAGIVVVKPSCVPAQCASIPETMLLMHSALVSSLL